MYFSFYERISLAVYITIRNTSRLKKRVAFCARCPSVGYAAQNATAVPRWDSRRKMRNHSANLRSLISVWKLDFSKKSMRRNLRLDFSKIKSPIPVWKLDFSEKKACGAFAIRLFISAEWFRILRQHSTTLGIGFAIRNCFPQTLGMVFLPPNCISKTSGICFRPQNHISNSSGICFWLKILSNNIINWFKRDETWCQSNRIV